METIQALIWSAIAVTVALASPLPDAVKCRTSGNADCTVRNTYGSFPDRSECRATEIVYPANEQELLEAVKSASKLQQSMRVVTRWSHSIPKLACPGGNGRGVLISTVNLTRILQVDSVAMTVTVESGVSLRQLVDVAAQFDMALPHAPYWDALSVGGMISTGAHGSSIFPNAPSSVHDYVIAMRLVAPLPPGNASIIALNESSADLNAAKVALGLLGAISQVTLKLQPMFKRSITNVRQKDENFEEEIEYFGRSHEFADFTWFPAQRAVIYRRDDRVAVTERGDGVNDFVGFRPTLTAALNLVRLAEEAQETAKNAKGKCEAAKIQTSAISGVGNGFLNNKVAFTGYPVVGFQHRLQSSASCARSAFDGLLTACAWDPRVKGAFFHQTTFAIPLSKIKSFVSDVKRLRDMVPDALCGVELYNGILMRFVTASPAFLAVDEDSVDIDITYYRSRDPMTPRLYEDVLEEIEQMGLFKYGGTPHWGKNRNVGFVGVAEKYKNLGRFVEAMNRFDPTGLFSNEWTQSIFGEGKEEVMIWKDGCALEGLCICSNDSHCAPHKRYFCRSGRVYRDAKVCRFE